MFRHSGEMGAPGATCQSRQEHAATRRTFPADAEETAETGEEAEDDGAAKTQEQRAQESKAFLEEERRRELPKDDWPGKGEA